jgi:hypothetical protein
MERSEDESPGLLASIAHRLALAVLAGGLPALIMLIGAGPDPDERRLADCVPKPRGRLGISTRSGARAALKALSSLRPDTTGGSLAGTRPLAIDPRASLPSARRGKLAARVRV